MSYGDVTPADMKEASRDFLTFVLKFYAKYEDIRRESSGLYFVSQSYGGKYGAQFISDIMKYNKRLSQPKNRIPLKATILGNPYPSPMVQRLAMNLVPYALSFID